MGRVRKIKANGYFFSNLLTLLGYQLIRDLNLIRKLILAVEASPTGYVQDEIEINGYSEEQIGYHAYLLVNAGLANGIDATTIADTSPQ